MRLNEPDSKTAEFLGVGEARIHNMFVSTPDLKEGTLDRCEFLVNGDLDMCICRTTSEAIHGHQ